MSLAQRVQRMRQSKDDMEVGHWEQVLLPPREPALARLGLTFGQCRLRHELYETAWRSHREQESRWPPSAAVRHLVMARNTLSCW